MKEELMKKANEVNTYDFVRAYMPGEYIECGDGQIRLRNNNSVMVTQCIHKTGKSGWVDWGTGDRGNAITFLMHFFGMSVPLAAETVLRTMEGYAPTETETTKKYIHPRSRDEKIQTYSVPEKAPSQRNMFAYLCQARSIPADIVQDLFNRGLIYQTDNEKYKNIVFMKPDKTYYEVRGANSLLDTRCKYSNKCCQAKLAADGTCEKHCEHFKGVSFKGKETCNRDMQKDFWYFWGVSDPVEKKNPPVNVIICEAAIDAISIYALQRMQGIDTHDTVYVSVGGVNNTSPIDYIADCYTKFETHIYIATDNDKAGNRCANIYPQLQRLTTPEGIKDWNELLQRTVRR